MIRVLVYGSDALVGEAEAETAEAGMLAARTLWDDWVNAMRSQGTARRTRVVFEVEQGEDDKLDRFVVEGRRP